MLFTAFPVLVFAGLDRDIEAHHVLVLPELYSTGQYRVPTTTRPLARALGLRQLPRIDAGRWTAVIQAPFPARWRGCSLLTQPSIEYSASRGA